MKNKVLKFDEYSKKALVIMENTMENLYLTGKAGAGKSTIVDYFISKTKKKFILLGTTGISAINIGGVTIHSFFWITPKLKVKTMSKDKIKLIQETDVFIIDEVSMLRADLFDILNWLMQHIMDNDLFMGWKQFIFVWDLYQLPPVVTNSDEEFKKIYSWPFFFNGKTYEADKFVTVELQKVHRQTDTKFINALNAIRIGYKWKDVLDIFNSRLITKNEINKNAIFLGTTNFIVDQINRERLSELPWQEYCFTAFINGDFPKEDYPTDRVIKLKVWSRIMFTKNADSFSNWTLGEIVDIFNNKIKIKTDDWIMVDLERFRWKNTDWEDEIGEEIVIGEFSQFPLKLGFATTIHKAQGKTFDNIVIELWNGAFTEWQTYVWISRGTSLEGIQILTEVKAKDIKVSMQVKEFLNH